MRVYQNTINGKIDSGDLKLDFDPDLVLLFISPDFDYTDAVLSVVNEAFPQATITGCSTSGEIADTSVNDNSIVINAIKFEKTDHKMSHVKISEHEDSFKAGQVLSANLKRENLQHILIFSEGLAVNGSELVRGLNSDIEENVSVTGGMAGDGMDFNNTFTIRNGQKTEGEIIGIGLYGKNLNIGYSSKGGWDSFGIERNVTKAVGNVLYELDGQPALALYKSYLGEKAKDLPSSGLLFPLSLRTKEYQYPVVRTILGIDEAEQSLTFAASIPEGSYVRLMKANVDRIINGAESSAKNTRKAMAEEADFALLVSCVGRRLVLKQLVEEEVEAVREILGEKPILSGFYSYGELAPFDAHNECRLHNQTMTITTFSES